MIDTLYTVLKDILGASSSRKSALLSGEQIDITIKELRRQFMVQVVEIDRDAANKQGESDQDLVSRGLYDSTLKAGRDREIDGDRRRRIKDAQDQLEYVENMLRLEAQKFGVELSLECSASALS